MAVPPCHSRRSLEGQSNLYFCAHPLLHSNNQLVTEEVCRVCPLWREPPPAEFRAFPPVPPPLPRGLCHYLGEETGLRECPSCRGMVRLKVFACHHPRHRETVLTECASCVDYEALSNEKTEVPSLAEPGK